MLLGDGAKNLDDFRFAHVGRHGGLGMRVEVLLVHELLELGHLVQLNANGLLLMLELGHEALLVDTLRGQKALITGLGLDTELVLVVAHQCLNVVLAD